MGQRIAPGTVIDDPDQNKKLPVGTVVDDSGRVVSPPPQKRAGILDLAKGLAGVVVDPLSAVSPQTKNTLMEGSIGAVKRTGQIATDWAQGPQAVVNRVQGGQPESSRPELQPKGGAQTAGSFIPDIAIAAATGGAAGPATRMQHRAARMWQGAAQRPVTETVDKPLRILNARLGNLTRDNAEAWKQIAPSRSSALDMFDPGVLAAEANPQSGWGLATGSFSPGMRSKAAQAIFDMGRQPVQQTFGAGGMAVMQALQRLLSGGQ